MAYYDDFKRIRNHLRKYDAEQVVLGCIDRLHGPDAYSPEKMRVQPPWFLFLLIKWALVHGDIGAHGKRALTNQELNRMVNMLHQLSDTAPLPAAVDHPLVLLRGIGYQQFWHQQDVHTPAMLRQGALFGELDSGSTLQKMFLGQTGLCIDDFIELAWMTSTAFVIGNQPFVDDQWFSHVRDSFPLGAVGKFLSTVARTPTEVQTYLRTVDGKHRQPSEMFEQTPLLRYPLLTIGTRHICYSPRMAQYALGNLVYEILREVDARAFMEEFGRMFEAYVEKALRTVPARVYTEAQLQSIIGVANQV